MPGYSLPMVRCEWERCRASFRPTKMAGHHNRFPQQSLFPGGRVSPSRRPDTRWLPVPPRVQYLPVSGLRAGEKRNAAGAKDWRLCPTARVRELVEGGAGVADVRNGHWACRCGPRTG